jgi:hypothetical protein
MIKRSGANIDKVVTMNGLRKTAAATHVNAAANNGGAADLTQRVTNIPRPPIMITTSDITVIVPIPKPVLKNQTATLIKAIAPAASTAASGL